MRKKHLFWMLQIIMVLVLSATMAYAQFDQDPITPQVDELGQLIDENYDSVNPAAVCLDCEAKDAGYRIYYETCDSTTTQSGTTVTGQYWAFDRDVAFDFASVNGTLEATEQAHWTTTSGTYSHLGYCTDNYPSDNYLFAICNCVLKTQFLAGEAYVFEVEVIGDGVYWSDRNLTLLGDAGTVYDSADFETTGGHLTGPLGFDSIGPASFLTQYDLDNVIRYVVGTSTAFFCNGGWITGATGLNAAGWDYPLSAGDYSWKLGYVAVQDYINRDYSATDFDLSTCTPGKTPFNLDTSGELGCPFNANAFRFVDAKVLRSYPTVIFPDDYPVLSQTPYLYIDLPTMVYRSDVASICDSVYVLITLAQPFRGVCASCCNLPMCSCTQYVGTFGCDPDDCEEGPGPSSETKCIPYITNMLNDGWWDFVVVANMSENSIAPTLTFYAGGESAEYPMTAIPAMSSSAVGLTGDISDYIAANYPAFPTEGAAIFAEVSVPGTDAFDAFYLTYNPEQGTTGYLARCAPCGDCSDK